MGKFVAVFQLYGSDRNKCQRCARGMGPCRYVEHGGNPVLPTRTVSLAALAAVLGYASTDQAGSHLVPP